MSVITRNNVQVTGNPHGRMIVFGHGFGCNQDMWRLVAPTFEEEYRVVLFDHVGAGGADPSAYDPQRHATLDGYAQDVVEILEALSAHDAVFVGHSVSSMIGVLAHLRATERITELALVCPSPRYLDEDGYTGGFTTADIQELLELLDRNHLAWSAAMAPTIMGNPDRPELTAELEASFCRTDPDLTRRFARATFLADNRRELATVTARTLVIQSANDAIAPIAVGRYVADQIPDSTLEILDVSGHAPNLSAPEQTAATLRRFLANRPRSATSTPARLRITG